MEDAKRYIDIHFKEDNCVEEATKIYQTTRRRFGDVFKTLYNITPNRYVISRRMEFAKELLSAGYIPIGEIAYLCGFSDIYYFSKVFKNETGVSPSEYKKIRKP